MFTARRLFPRPGAAARYLSAALPLPAAVDAVVVGGGIIGASTALSLAERGASVLVLEQNTLTSGTTWHAAGLIAQLKHCEAMVAMACHSTNLFASLEAAGESPVGWHNTGSLGLARSVEHWEQLRRAMELLQEAGVPYAVYDTADYADVAKLRAIHPLLDLSGVLGAIHTPTDGIVNPSDSCMAVVRAARAAGARFAEHCGAAAISTEGCGAALASAARGEAGGGVTLDAADVTRAHSVTTVDGETVACGAVVLACGSWTRQLAATIGVVVPTAIVPHQYAVFDKVAGVSNALPVVRDYMRKIYVKPEVGGIAVGAFESPHTDMPAVVAARNASSFVPADAQSELYEQSMDKLEAGLGAAIELLPALAEVGIKQWVHGPDTHSCDHEPVLGRAPFTDNVFVATGFNSQGIQTGPGVGRAMAGWVLDGSPEAVAFPGIDFSSCDVRRFHPPSVAPEAWGTARALEGYAKEFGEHPPHEQWEAGRGVRLSPLHGRLAAAGALFGSVGAAGWERPLHFPPREAGFAPPPCPLEGGGTAKARLFEDEALSFDKAACDWVVSAAREHTACREGVGLFDLSSFGKLLVTGPRAEALLEWAASSSVQAAPDGRVLYTQMLNERGGVESDLTMVSLPPTDPLLEGLASDNAASGCAASGGASGRGFYLVTAGTACTRDADHLQRCAAALGLARGDATLHDVTDDFAVLALNGPESRALLRQLWVPPVGDIEGIGDDDALGDVAFPFGTMQNGALQLGGGDSGNVLVACRALRISFAGELGWELHVQSADAPAVFDALHTAASGSRRCRIDVDPLPGGVFNGGRGLINCGYRALLESLRLEKGYMHFGHEVIPAYTALEAGLGFVSAAKLKADTPFSGREALLAQKKVGVSRRLVSFALGEAHADVSLWGHEGIWRDNVRVGFLTSGGIGHTINGGRAIGMGYVESPGGGRVTKKHVNEGAYEVEVAGRRIPIEASWGALG